MLYNIYDYVMTATPWWRPNSWGYTNNRAEAGEYTLEEAVGIVLRTNVNNQFRRPDWPEVAIKMVRTDEEP